jgi:hypothetical protein
MSGSCIIVTVNALLLNASTSPTRRRIHETESQDRARRRSCVTGQPSRSA